MGSIKLNYEGLGDDGLSERVNRELADIVANIDDPNTDPKAMRELTVKIKIKPDEKRSFANINYVVTTKKAPAKPVEITAMVAPDQHGELSLFVNEYGQNPDQHDLPIEKPQNVTPMKEVARG